jgi:hypothetical protein
MRKKPFAILIVCLVFSGMAICQVNEADRGNINRIYEQAEKLFRSGDYSASLEYLKRDGGTYLNSSDSLLYLKIKNLEKLYRADFLHTTDLESSLKLFLSRASNYSFPELKYSEVTRVYSEFSSFKERDKMFYDSISHAIDLTQPAILPGLRRVTANYLKATPNTYYNKELNAYVTDIDNNLAALAVKQKKQELDSSNRGRLKLVGKNMALNLSYTVPSGGKRSFPGLHTYDDAVNFFDGKSSGGLGERYALNASLAETVINLYTGTRVKAAIDWNLFNVEYAVFDWTKDTLMHDKANSGTHIDNLKSLEAGTRIGPMVAVLLTKRIAVGFYYSARPAIQFLLHTSYFNDGTGSYSISPVIANFNLSHEIGLKFYFFERLCISPYLHFGTYNWKNDIKDISGNAADLRVQADYKFKYIGLRIGF